MPQLGRPFIVVSGTIGGGKSTLIARLAEVLDIPPYFEEPEHNPFFGPPDVNAANAELWFLTRALSAVHKAGGIDGGIVERPPEEHLEIFVRYRTERGWISAEERSLLESSYTVASPGVRPPDLLVHLDLDAQTALRRVEERGRPAEEKVDIEYLQALAPLYEDFLRRWDLCPVLRVDIGQLDLRQPSAFDLVLSDVRALLSRRLPVVLADGGRLPRRAHPGDAGLDLCAAIDAELGPLERLAVPTGVSMHIPDGYVGLIVPRSGYARDHGITHLDGPGIIDAGYRGIVHFLLYNTDKDQVFRVRRGDRLGQVVIVPFADLRPIEVPGLAPSARNAAGFGSSNEPAGD